MSVPIRLTEQMIKETLLDVEKELRSARLFGGQGSVPLNWTYTGKDHATITFTPIAWRKQMKLVQDFYTEVGWHGICKRDPEDASNFIVEDIIIFPQLVTSATVVPDQAEYNEWLESLPDEQFNNCRFHGHSHVNMAPSPSGTDTTYQKQLSGRLEGDGFTEEVKASIIEELGDSAFYVFLIINKRGEYTARIRDLKNNVEYDTKEITLVHDDPDDLSDFIAEAKKIVLTSAQKSQNKSNSSANNKNAPNQKNLPAAIPSNKNDTPKGNPSTKNEDEDHLEYPFGLYDGENWHDKYNVH